MNIAKMNAAKLLMLFIASLLSCITQADVVTDANDISGAVEGSKTGIRQYTFAWPYTEESEMAPRGGTTKGAKLELVLDASERWEMLQEPGLTKQEKDRRAILAMAGHYRASFDFLETNVFEPPYAPSAPYQSWGTEYVYVLADEPDFLSLQHILVMFMEDEEGEVQGPFVVKHWRQDWHYQDREMHTYRGDRTWALETLNRKQVKGQWSQTVYQVDDSPRYESYGEWVHQANYSSWISQTTWRPLPRREFSVRDDYQALVGTNRHTITPTGWIHEEHNLKAQLDNGEISRVIAQESGFNRYERITGHDFSSGDDYWEKTSAFWEVVRQKWEDIYNEENVFTLRDDLDQNLIFVMFEYAERQYADKSEIEEAVDSLLGKYVVTPG